MLDKIRRMLVLAPHTDDGELGCGATISKLLRKNVEIYYVAFSSCEESLVQDCHPTLLSRNYMKQQIF
jgi:LmbE family N-acetylglucosaminyl deacetylase